MGDTSTVLVQEEIERALKSGEGPAVVRFLVSFLSGGPVGAFTSAWSEADQDQLNRLIYAWMKLQQDEILEIGKTMQEVVTKVDRESETVKARMASPEYLKIVKKCFRDWSAAESEQKRRLVRNLLINAASTRLVADDMVMLFVAWIGDYSEAHFTVVKEIYHQKGITRQQVAKRIYEEIPREDSANADLFKLIFHDLSMGHIIRQHRETDGHGNFYKASGKSSRSPYSKSAFDNDEEYELTELGMQFVHYTMNEETTKIETGSSL